MASSAAASAAAGGAPAPAPAGVLAPLRLGEARSVDVWLAFVEVKPIAAPVHFQEGEWPADIGYNPGGVLVEDPPTVYTYTGKARLGTYLLDIGDTPAAGGGGGGGGGGRGLGGGWSCDAAVIAAAAEVVSAFGGRTRLVPPPPHGGPRGPRKVLVCGDNGCPLFTGPPSLYPQDKPHMHTSNTTPPSASFRPNAVVRTADGAVAAVIVQVERVNYSEQIGAQIEKSLQSSMISSGAGGAGLPVYVVNESISVY